MNYKNLLASSVILATAAVEANATQITLGNSDLGGVFTLTGDGLALTVSATQVRGTNQAFYGGDVGTYTFGVTSFVAGPSRGGHFPANGFEPLTVTFADGDTASGVVNWTAIKDSYSLMPDLIGVWNVEVTIGDAAFLADFHTGAVASVDLTLLRPSLDQLVIFCDTASAPIPSGEITPGGTPVPEPDVNLVFAGGLAVLGFWRLKRPRGTRISASRLLGI